MSSTCFLIKTASKTRNAKVSETSNVRSWKEKERIERSTETAITWRVEKKSGVSLKAKPKNKGWRKKRERKKAKIARVEWEKFDVKKTEIIGIKESSVSQR